jgi:hypothetical protein
MKKICEAWDRKQRRACRRVAKVYDYNKRSLCHQHADELALDTLYMSDEAIWAMNRLWGVT